MKRMHEIPFDQYQRYEICRRLINDYSVGEKIKILDVGGFFIGPNGQPLLPATEFFEGNEVLVIDTMDVETPNYMKSDGRNLPFEDGTFDFVITNDVLEHIQPNDRQRFIRELQRVSRKYVIINNPYYTPKTALAEKILYEYLVNVLDTEHEMLGEHLKYGLPTIDMITATLNNYNPNYKYYFSGDIDNWLYLMILRHELMSKKVGHLVNYIDSFYNQFNFELEMNLQQGYRVTMIIATSNDTQLLKHNFFDNITKSDGSKIQLPFSSIIDLYNLKSENEQKSILDSYYYKFDAVTPRMKRNVKISQNFICHSTNLYKVGLLVATFMESLTGYCKISLTDLQDGQLLVENIISMKDFVDNNWYYIDFPPLINSKNKKYSIELENISNSPGCALYYSKDNNYGELIINNDVISGGLAIKVYTRDVNQAEKYVLLNQENLNSLQHIKLLEQKLNESESQLNELKVHYEQKQLQVNNAVLIEQALKEHISELKQNSSSMYAFLIEQSKLLESQFETMNLNLQNIKDSKTEKNNLEISSLKHQIEKNDLEINSLKHHIVEKENNHNNIVNILTQQIADKDQELKLVYGTFSWKLTKPLRWTTHKKRQFFKFCKAYSRFVSKNGGFIVGSIKAPFKVLKVLNKQGFKVVLQKIRQQNPTTPYKPGYQVSSLNAFSVNQIRENSPVSQHKKPVDIIVCVHNAHDDVKRCLESIVKFTKPPYTIIIVDDGSKEETAEFVNRFAMLQKAVLVRNEEAKGYTLAANQGLRKSTAEYVVLLNSDTVVTTGWLDRMITCAESNDNFGIVGPLSNTASWQSVPKLLENGDWADNDLPDGITISDMAQIISNFSGRVYPTIPFLNGFCLMIKRKVIDDIGYFDEVTFAKGYGEENDYCLRVRKEGYELAIADDAYVFHAQSKSYSHERRKILAQQADLALSIKHGQDIISSGVEVCRYDKVLEGIRARSEIMLERYELIKDGIDQFEGKSVLFILPTMDAGGGANVVIQEAEAMLDMGVDVRILNLASHRDSFEMSYANDNFRVPVIYVEDLHEIDNIACNFDGVVATAYQTVSWMKDCSTNGQPIRAYYIQDFEPYFFEKDSTPYQQAWNSYNMYPDLIRITKTDWNQREVKRQIGVNSYLVGPSVNIDLFRPRVRRDSNWPNRPLRIAAMIRPSTPRRNPGFTLEVLKEISVKHGSNIEIILFGCQSDDPGFLQFDLDFHWKNAGVLTRKKLAWLFNEVDIFVDFSSFQAMGLTAMEAMATGVAVIAPKQGGVTSFLRHNENGLIVDSTSKDGCISALNKLIFDQGLREKVQRQAIYDICKYATENAAYKILESMFNRG